MLMLGMVELSKSRSKDGSLVNAVSGCFGETLRWSSLAHPYADSNELLIVEFCCCRVFRIRRIRERRTAVG